MAAAQLVLDDLEEGTNQFSFDSSAESLGLKDDFLVFPGMVNAKISVRRSMENFYLDGQVECRVGGDCYRCLEKMEEKLATQFRLLIQRRQASPEELESAEDDGFIEIVDPGTRLVDMAAYICEAIVLDLPIRIPSEASKGICPHCGSEDAPTGDGDKEQSDPRWDALKNIEFSPKQ